LGLGLRLGLGLGLRLGLGQVLGGIVHQRHSSRTCGSATCDSSTSNRYSGGK